MTPKLKINLATKLLALVAASCALVTGGRAARVPQTACESNIIDAARLAQRGDTSRRASGILMGDKTAGSEIVSLSGGNVCVK